MADCDVLIIGGGVAGLTCARVLDAAGCDWQLVEAQPVLGGRVRTHEVDGFRLDEGFQVLLTAYPEAQRFLDYGALDLHAFLPGAHLRRDGSGHALVDPRRAPHRALGALTSPAATWGDRLRVLGWVRRVTRGEAATLWDAPDESTTDYLLRAGFSARFREEFLSPFLRGVTLDSGLTISRRFVDYTWRMFATGSAALPRGGIGRIPEVLAAPLPTARIRTSLRVEALEGDQARIGDGTTIKARRIVLATHAPSAYTLAGETNAPPGRSVSCHYFAAPHPPLRAPLLVLNATGQGPVNNLAVLSQVAPGYAPRGQALISATVLGSGHASSREVRQQLRGWFGKGVDAWHDLEVVHIPYALPARPGLDPAAAPVQWTDQLFVCGDHRDVPSLNGAMASGRRAAEAILASLA